MCMELYIDIVQCLGSPSAAVVGQKESKTRDSENYNCAHESVA